MSEPAFAAAATRIGLKYFSSNHVSPRMSICVLHEGLREECQALLSENLIGCAMRLTTFRVSCVAWTTSFDA